MCYNYLAAALAVLVLLDPTASAAEKIQLKVLYAGKPNDTRTKDFVSFLQQHFVRVGEVDYEKFKADEAKDFDVVLIPERRNHVGTVSSCFGTDCNTRSGIRREPSRSEP